MKTDILSRFKTHKDIIANLEKKVEDQRDRANHFRDSLVKVEQRLGYLECKKHSYKYAGTRKVGVMILGPVVFAQGETGYVFTCVHCLHEMVKIEKDLNALQRRALKELKILEAEDEQEKN